MKSKWRNLTFPSSAKLFSDYYIIFQTIFQIINTGKMKKFYEEKIKRHMTSKTFVSINNNLHKNRVSNINQQKSDYRTLENVV